MPEKLKYLFFTADSLETFARELKRYYPDFDPSRFLSLVFEDTWPSLELKQRMRHTTRCLHQTLPSDFNTAIAILKQAAPRITGFEAMTLHDYVELYGQEDLEASLQAIRYFNPFASGEFAIRPFLLQHPEPTMDFMLDCANDADEKNRRFASEGCRPRLPWAMALPAFKADPSPILPILEKLKDDESEFVRKSVANNLNDISKDHPDLVLDVCESWKDQSPRTDWIIKRACRTLLKAGNVRAMRLFGFGDPVNLSIEQLSFNVSRLRIGEDLVFSFDLLVKEPQPCKVRLEYSVDYVKASGKRSIKMFQISENTYNPGTVSITRKQTFQDMSTRKHVPGPHEIAIVVNGVEKARKTVTIE